MKLKPEEWAERACQFWAEFPPDLNNQFPIFIVQCRTRAEVYWVVQDASYLLNRELLWERRLHSDDGEQGQRTRFQTPDEAMAVYRQWKAIDSLPLGQVKSAQEDKLM